MSVCVNIMSGFIKIARYDCKAGLVARCSHVTDLLLMLSKYILENDHVVEKASTSLPCSRNKRKKRNKTPRKLDESIYESSKRKHTDDLYHWDPRPSEYKRQFSENLEQHTSLFVRKLQTINKDKLSMWETLMKVTYDNFVHDDDDEKLYYKYLVRNFEICLADNIANISENSFSGQLPGTKEPSSSETWFQERCFRITASVCKNVVLIGRKIKKKTDAKHQFFDYIENHF